MKWRKGVIRDKGGNPKLDERGRVVTSDYFVTSLCGRYQVSKAFVGDDRAADVRYQAWRLKDGAMLGVCREFSGDEGAAALCVADSLK